jgi:AcrR family transcriptional regulator
LIRCSRTQNGAEETGTAIDPTKKESSLEKIIRQISQKHEPNLAFAIVMSVPSRLNTTPRRVPQQRRGKRRVSALLDTAATVIAEKGYEQATMSEIARRAHSSIGSLYQFFPNKQAVAEAVREQYIEDINRSWTDLVGVAAKLSPEQLSRRLVTVQLEIVERHPALLALLEIPPTSRTWRRRELIRVRVAMALMAHKPRLGESKALRIASVVQLVSRGLLTLYAKSDDRERAGIVEEFKAVLVGYLAPKLKSQRG